TRPLRIVMLALRRTGVGVRRPWSLSLLVLPARVRDRLRLSRDIRAVRRSRLFGETFYLEQNPDVAAAGVDPVVHYLTCGAAEGRNPNEWFETSWYLEAYPDVARAGLNPLLHYIRYGRREG